MSQPTEGLPGLQIPPNLDLSRLREELNQLSRPRTILMDPQAAPESMLARVQVHPDGLELSTKAGGIGEITLRAYHGARDAEGMPLARFASPLQPAEMSDETRVQAPLLQAYPYITLGDRDSYALVLEAPAEALDADWSEPHDTPLGEIAEAGRIIEYFPELKEAGLTGQYYVDVQQQTLSGLDIAVRLNNKEPQIREQRVKGWQSIYLEQMKGFIKHSESPGAAIVAANARYTIKPPNAEGKHDVDVQEWEFVLPDSYQKSETETEGRSGLVEVIVFRTKRVKHGPINLKPYTPPPLPAPPILKDGSDPYLFDSHSRSGFRSHLSAGETRYRTPQIFRSGEIPRVKEARAIAAFRFALTGVTA